MTSQRLLASQDGVCTTEIKFLVFGLKHKVSETGFSLGLQEENTHLSPIDRTSTYLLNVVFNLRNGVG
jgi:hypothetical protein